MNRLTKAKAKEFVKRELGVAAGQLLDFDPQMNRNLQDPWFRADLGQLTVTVYTLEEGQVTQLLLQYGDCCIATHFFTDTLEPFYMYTEMRESQNEGDRSGETCERTRRCEYEVRHLLQEHYNPTQPKQQPIHVDFELGMER